MKTQSQGLKGISGSAPKGFADSSADRNLSVDEMIICRKVGILEIMMKY